MRLFRSFSWSFLLLGFLLLPRLLSAQSTPPFAYTSAPGDSLGRQRELNEHVAKDTTGLWAAQQRLAEERERLLSQFGDRQLSGTGGIANMTWQERGPSNAGGRTLAALFDPNDPNRKKVWVASPLGGLWYNNNITDSTGTWTPVSDVWASMVVTCLAADPSNPQIMYAGTGDNEQGAFGGGIWKTTNGGATWARLSSTIPGGNYGSLSSSFGYVQRIVVNNSGNVFAATQYGVVRSTDGGASWQFALAPNQAIGVAATPTTNYYYDLAYSLEIGTDGVLYTALRTAKLYKATNAAGSAWREITPPNLPATGERTTVALAPSTSGSRQVIYAMSRAYNNTTYGQDVRWFRKSSDAGATWSAVTIPAYNTGTHFTNGNGYGALNLIVDPTNPAVLYAGSYGYDWFRSTTGGETWSVPLPVGSQYIIQYGLVFQPGNADNAVLINGSGVSWTTGWGTATTSTAPRVISRNRGYRTGHIGDVAMKATPGSAYLMAAVWGTGLSTLTKPGLGEISTTIYNTNGGLAQVVIDADEPTIQLFNAYGVWYQVSGNSYRSIFSGDCGGGGSSSVAYDSQNNTLYVADGCSNAYGVRRVTGIGGTINQTRFTTGNYVRAIQLSSDRKSLFVASQSELVKYSNLDQATPTATTIARDGTFPMNTVISSINVGATDNELLITLWNTNTGSVWYTNNGGVNWINKGSAETGLPNVPAWTGLVNPQNPKQVVLGTELGIWTTGDISAANPNWTLSNAGMPLVEISQLRYRASDGKLVAATAGRGIFETDALAVPYSPSSIAITNVSTTALCAGSSVAVSFSTTGPAFAKTGTYEVWVSDATGNFANQRQLGMGTSSPVSVTLPSGTSALPYGTAYRIKVVAVDVELTSSASSQVLEIGNLNTVAITDRRRKLWNSRTSASICSGDLVKLGVSVNGKTESGVVADSYQWIKNGFAVTGATSQTYLAEPTSGTSTADWQQGSFQVVLKQAGCTVRSDEYSIYGSKSVNSSISSRFDGVPHCNDKPDTLIADYAGESASLQWTRDGTVIPNATSSIYLATQSGNYTVRVTRSDCNAYASPLTVTLGRSLLAQVKASGEDSVLCASTSNGYVSLYADNISSKQVGGPDGYSIQWYKDNVPTYQNGIYFYATQSGAYTYELQQGSCRTRSGAFVVRQQVVMQPIIRVDGDVIPHTICQGETKTLYLQNGSYWTRQWQKDGIDIPNATGGSYNAQSSGKYTVRVTKGSCAGTSTPFSLTFTNVIVPQIAMSNAEACSNIYIRTSSRYNDRIQWYKDATLISGESESMLSVRQQGYYSVRLTNGECSGVSNPVFIQPYSQRKPVIISTATGVCADNTAQLRADSYSGSLQWKQDGRTLTGQTTWIHYPTTSGRYTIQETNSCGVIESDPIEIKIGEPTNAVLTGTAFVSAGQPTTVPVTFTGPAPWSFTLSNGQSVQNTYLNPYPLTVTPSATTTYSITNLFNACGTGTSSGQAQVTVGNGKADLSITSQVSNRLVNVNDVVTYSLFVTNNGPQDAGDVVVTNRLPAGVAFVEAVSPGISQGDGLVRATVGSVQAGSTVELTYRLRVTQPGTFLNAAQITATNTPDPDSQPNSGTGDGQDDAATVDLRTGDGNNAVIASANPNQVPLFSVQGNQPPIARDSVELGLTLLSDIRVPQAGDVISLSLIVTNRGGTTANSAVVQFDLPAGWQLINNISGLDVNGQTVKAYLNPILANSRGTRVVDVQVQGGDNPVRAQILSVAEPVVNARPGNGYQNGERDEATLQIWVRN